MGIHDRDYYRAPSGSTFRVWARTAVGTIILLNVVVWVLQVLTRDSGLVRGILASRGEAIFGGFPQIWRLVTANFAHSEADIFHILWNMLFLFWFGRELEQIYGRSEFWFFYLLSGVSAVLAESLVQFARGQPYASFPILGASGAVMGVVVLYTLFYPRRTILLFFMLPVPLWLLCVIYIGRDLLGAMDPNGSNVAHFAHLTGAASGFLFWRFDARWATFWKPLLGLAERRRRRRRRHAAVPRRDARDEAARSRDAKPDPVSERMDALLEKIHKHGMGSLTDEEREFMIENSRRYRSR